MGTFVVGLDGSEESIDALRWTLALAGTEHRVRGVVVWTYPVVAEVGYGGGVTPTIAYEEIEAAAQTILERSLAQVEPGDVDLTGELTMAASPSGGLIEAAGDADLLVVGTRHHSTLDRVILGSVAIQCAHHAPCAFVAVPASPPPVGDVIAVAVDGSDSAVAALGWAASIAAGAGCRLRVISVWERVGWSTGPRLVDPDRTDDERALDELRARVDEIIPGATDVEYVPVHAERHVAEHILEAAQGTGLLVMGSRGRGGFTGLLLGSVSQRCLEYSMIPVAVLRS